MKSWNGNNWREIKKRSKKRLKTKSNVNIEMEQRNDVFFFLNGHRRDAIVAFDVVAKGGKSEPDNNGNKKRCWRKDVNEEKR